ncbi:MAG: 16S rRNA (guanine(966)-N(2))-methyltransferase RsmD [Candidatus Aquirickettsiella gammari]
MNHHKNRQNPSAPPVLRANLRTNHRQTSHQIRIIGGLWKRTPLTVISAEGLRPTPDRVRETVFNWLHHLLNGQWGNISCLDMFAGSGALGFEAASRGASQVTMFEAFAPAYKQLEQTKEKLKAAQVRLQRGDALLLVKNLLASQQKFDVIFLDPPFNLGFLEKILPLCKDLLRPTGILYVESEQALTLDSVSGAPVLVSGWQVLRQDKAGNVHFHLLQRNTESGEAV